MLLCCDFEERIVLPFVLRAVTPFAEPEKSLNAMDGLTIIVSDLVKQPCDPDYKYSNIMLINQIIDRYNLNKYFSFTECHLAAIGTIVSHICFGSPY